MKTVVCSALGGLKGRGLRNRCREEVPFSDCMGEGVKEDTVLCLFLVQSVCSSGPRVSVAEEACWVCLQSHC